MWTHAMSAFQAVAESKPSGEKDAKPDRRSRRT
jgi:hypothetical protein